MKEFFKFMGEVSEQIQQSGRFGTAHVYRSTRKALREFYPRQRLFFREFTSVLLKNFETFLRKKGCSWNTVSTYMRVLRAVYNRAVELSMAPVVPHLFKHVYTGLHTEKKRAVDNGEMARLLKEEQSAPVSGVLQQAHDYFILMFLMRGLPFVDLAYLKKTDLCGNVLTYRRRKTGKNMRIVLTAEARILIDRHYNCDVKSPYLFPIIRSSEGSVLAYHEYQCALRSFNRRLRQLRSTLNLRSLLSTYAARHTWATMAYYSEQHPGVISESLGHSSITVTENYLKNFRNDRLDIANVAVIKFAKEFTGSSLWK